MDQIHELSEQLQAAFIGYDEGMQSDDIVLAGALWRRMYQMEEADPEHLEKLVKYIRKNVSNIFMLLNILCDTGNEIASKI